MIELSFHVEPEDENHNNNENNNENNDNIHHDIQNNDNKSNPLNPSNSNNEKEPIKHLIFCLLYFPILFSILGCFVWNYILTKDNLSSIPMVYLPNEDLCKDKFILVNECIGESKDDPTKKVRCLDLSERLSTCYEQAKNFKSKCFLLIGEYKQCCELNINQPAKCKTIENILKKCMKPFNYISFVLVNEIIKNNTS